MTMTEKKARIEKLESLRFYLSMKDRWDYKDYEQDRAWFNELLKLKKEVEAA